MANNIIAYVGIECFDLILYQARILTHLGKKVLIIDNIEKAVFFDAIPKPSTLENISEPITYRNIDYASIPLTTELAERYDDVFISYGFHLPDTACNKIYYMTDMYRHHIMAICNLIKDSSGTNITVLIRNVIDIEFNSEYLFGQLGKNISIEYIDYDEFDYEISILSLHHQKTELSALSKKTKKYLINQIKKLYPELTKRMMDQAYRATKGGR